MRGKLEQRLTTFSGGIRRAGATTTGLSGKFGQSAASGGGAQGNKTRREELQDGLDLIFDRRTGLLRRRDSNDFSTAFYGDLTALTAYVTSLMPASGLPAGAADQMLISDGATIWSFTAAGGPVSALTGLTANSLWHHVVAPQSGGQGPVYMMNGTLPRYWTGAAAGVWTASVGTLPVSRYLAYHNVRVWAANITAGAAVSDPKSALAWSDQGDPRSWPAANITMFDPNDGDELIGIGRIGPYLAVFKRRKTWLVYDLDTSANRQISASIGCISHRSIVETPHGLIFMSERGPAIFDGSTIKMIEDKLNLVSYIDLSASRDTLCQQVNAASTGDDYYVNAGFTRHTGPFPAYYTQNPLAHYDILNDAWWLHSCPTEHMAVWNGNAGVNELWGIDSNAAPTSLPGAATPRALVRMFTKKGSDQNYDRSSAGVRLINAFGQIRDLDWNSDTRKWYRSATIEGNGVFAVSFMVDGVGSSAPAVADLTSSSGLQRKTWPRPAGTRPGQRLGLQFYSQDNALVPTINPPPFELSAITLHADARAR